MNPIWDAVTTPLYDGRYFVPYHVGFYVREVGFISHRVVSYWDGETWYDGFYVSPKHNGIFNSPSSDQCGKFLGMQNEWQES